MIENTDAEQVELLNSRVVELLRERDEMRALMLAVVKEYPIASGLHVDLDGQDGYGPLKAIRKYLGIEPENAVAKGVSANE